ncbi:MAG: 2-amino-4-hydroxy-6-hydroxymethyldihydropteridine diphosphokinase [Magnetococcales bacterium]|nr:2-amino-4-hydroxy-6-hydroxymethyldihydropteridine diphosphokinase [Magnetococcales bacterium]
MSHLFRNNQLAWIAIGTNQGNSQALYRRVVSRISNHPRGLRLVGKSAIYRTQPVGNVKQPWFLNGVVVVETKYGPKALLNILHTIEHSFGRNRRREKRWGPRRMDLDLLFYGQRVLRTKNIKIPHPSLHLRRFVLTPLAEVSPQLIHPIFGKTVDMLLQDVDDAARVEHLLF